MLEVADNGRGFERGKAGRLDSYGLLGMRERAASIGAVLVVDTAPGQGSIIRCMLRPAPPPATKRLGAPARSVPARSA